MTIFKVGDRVDVFGDSRYNYICHNAIVTSIETGFPNLCPSVSYRCNCPDKISMCNFADANDVKLLQTIDLNIGDRIISISDKNGLSDNYNSGKKGTIISKDDFSVGVRYDDGVPGTYLLNETNKYYKKIKTTIMRKLSNYIKKATDTNVQELLKAGMINGDLEPTSFGFTELNQVLWFANYDALVARAKEINAEAEAEEKAGK